MLKTIAGNFGENQPIILKKGWSGRVKKIIIATGFFSSKKYNSTDISSVQQIDQENANSVVGALGWGAAGAVLLGPVGLLTGVFLGGRKNISVIAVEFKDGSRALIQGKSSETRLLLALSF